MIEKLPDFHKTTPHYQQYMMWTKINEIIDRLNKLDSHITKTDYPDVKVNL